MRRWAISALLLACKIVPFAAPTSSLSRQRPRDETDTGPGMPTRTEASRCHLCVSLTTTAAHPFIPFSRLRDPTRHAPAA